MKKTLFYSLIILMNIQCSQKDSTEVVSTNSDSSEIKKDNASSDDNLTLDVTNSVGSENLKNGDFKTYFPDGQLKVSGFVEQGKREGVWVSYFPNGNKQSENNYVNGLLSGKTVVFFQNGQIMYIGYYTNGQPDGEWLYFDEKGDMTKHLNYKAGVPYELPLD